MTRRHALIHIALAFALALGFGALGIGRAAAREVVQLAHLRAVAADAGLDPEFAEQVLSFIMSEVVRNHEAIARRRPGTSGD